MELNFEGIAVGAASLLVIGAFHPLVIWCEYHFSQKIWPLFLLCGLICLGLALFAHGLLSILLGLNTGAPRSSRLRMTVPGFRRFSMNC